MTGGWDCHAHLLGPHERSPLERWTASAGLVWQILRANPTALYG